MSEVDTQRGGGSQSASERVEGEWRVDMEKCISWEAWRQDYIAGPQAGGAHESRKVRQQDRQRVLQSLREGITTYYLLLR